MQTETDTERDGDVDAGAGRGTTCHTDKETQKPSGGEIETQRHDSTSNVFQAVGASQEASS